MAGGRWLPASATLLIEVSKCLLLKPALARGRLIQPDTPLCL
jgi:hypothetical protein